MAKKFNESKIVLMFRTAIRAQSQENYSPSTFEALLATCASSFMRAVAATFSSSVKHLAYIGVCGRKKMVKRPNKTVIAPSTKKSKATDCSHYSGFWQVP